MTENVIMGLNTATIRRSLSRHYLPPPLSMISLSLLLSFFPSIGIGEEFIYFRMLLQKYWSNLYHVFVKLFVKQKTIFY